MTTGKRESGIWGVLAALGVALLFTEQFTASEFGLGETLNVAAIVGTGRGVVHGILKNKAARDFIRELLDKYEEQPS